MELKWILSELWRRRVWVAVGLALSGLATLASLASISIFPPKITGKPVGYSTATSQMLVDTSRSQLVASGSDIGLLNEHASVLSDLLTSPMVLGYIGRAAGIAGDKIAVDPPIRSDLQRSQEEPTAEKRASQIVAERKVYRVEVDESSVFPAIATIAQAPTSKQAAALANAVPRGLSAYLTSVENAAATPRAQRVAILALAPAVGTPVSASADLEVGGLVLAITFVIWCGLVVALSKLLDGIFALRHVPQVCKPVSLQRRGPSIKGT